VIFSNFTLTQHRLVAAVHTCEVVLLADFQLSDIIVIV